MDNSTTFTNLSSNDSAVTPGTLQRTAETSVELLLAVPPSMTAQNSVELLSAVPPSTTAQNSVVEAPESTVSSNNGSVTSDISELLDIDDEPDIPSLRTEATSDAIIMEQDGK